MSRAPTILPPDPKPNKPKFKAPPGSCDAHTHIFGPGDQYPYAADASYIPHDAGLADFRWLHDAIGIERAVIVNASCHGLDNSVVTDAIAASNGRYKGVGNVDDSFTEEQIDALDKGGIHGCRLTFLTRLGRTPDMSAFYRVVDKIKHFGWHVVIYLNPESVADFAPILTKLPVPYLIDHMGTVDAGKGLDQPNFNALMDLFQRDEKCWVKVCGFERASKSGPPFHDAVPFGKKLVEAVPDRVLWGTDWPHPNVKIMPNDGDLVDLIPLYATTPELQQKLLVDNPARLYKFG